MCVCVCAQVTHMICVPGIPDVWHVSIQNPTASSIKVVLHSAMGLPHFVLGDATVEVGGCGWDCGCIVSERREAS